MKRTSLLAKQIIQISIPLATMIAVIVVIFYTNSIGLGKFAEEFKEESFTGINLVLNADRDFYQSLDGFNNMLIHDKGSDKFNEAKDSYLDNIGDVETRMGGIRDISNQNSVVASLSNDETTTVSQRIDIFFSAYGEWKVATNEIVSKIESGTMADEIKGDIEKSNVLFNVARDEMNGIEESLELYPDILSQKHQDLSRKNSEYIFYTSLLIVGAAIVFVLFRIKSLVKALIKISEHEKNLVKSLKVASVELTESSHQLSEGSTEQAASIEQTSATMDETSSMVRQNTENTRQANDLSNEASLAAIEGSSKMKDMTVSMDELKKSSAEISKIIKVIDDIAFQTNMLALNAAVEAARAGDAGLGFAVVAEEVRNLAQKSAAAAKDTAEIIDKNIELSHQGVTVSADVNVSLEEIVSKTQNVNELMGKISLASEEQSKGINQVTQAIGQMEGVVQQNAASAEQSAASAGELKNQANELEGIVVELNALVHGGKKQGEVKENIEKQKAFKKPVNMQTGAVKHIVSPDDVIPLDGGDDF